MGGCSWHTVSQAAALTPAPLQLHLGVDMRCSVPRLEVGVLASAVVPGVPCTH